MTQNHMTTPAPTLPPPHAGEGFQTIDPYFDQAEADQWPDPSPYRNIGELRDPNMFTFDVVNPRSPEEAQDFVRQVFDKSNRMFDEYAHLVWRDEKTGAERLSLRSTPVSSEFIPSSQELIRYTEPDGTRVIAERDAGMVRTQIGKYYPTGLELRKKGDEPAVLDKTFYRKPRRIIPMEVTKLDIMKQGHDAAYLSVEVLDTFEPVARPPRPVRMARAIGRSAMDFYHSIPR